MVEAAGELFLGVGPAAPGLRLMLRTGPRWSSSSLKFLSRGLGFLFKVPVRCR
jgi:hypothetical protein